MGSPGGLPLALPCRGWAWALLRGGIRNLAGRAVPRVISEAVEVAGGW